MASLPFAVVLSTPTGNYLNAGFQAEFAPESVMVPESVVVEAVDDGAERRQEIEADMEQDRDREVAPPDGYRAGECAQAEQGGHDHEGAPAGIERRVRGASSLGAD